MGKGTGRKRGGKPKSDGASKASPQHGPEKITKYLPSLQAANSGASTATVVNEKEEESLVENGTAADIFPGILTPESTPTKAPYVPGREESPSPDNTLPYPLDEHSLPGADEELHGAVGGAKAKRAGSATRLKVKKEGNVQSAGNTSELTDTPPRHKMQLSKARHSQRTPKSVAASRSFNGQLDDEASPKNGRRVQGRGRKKGKSLTSSNSSSSKRRVKEEPAMKTIKDFFPVRRSDRRCKSVVDAERKLELEEAILSNKEEGLKVKEIIGKGRGVMSTKPFIRGQFVVEYYGDLIDVSTAKQRELKYKVDPDVGCYMYFFEHKNKNYCVDATQESGRLGRLLNHSRQGNCCTKLVEIAGRPHLILVAKRDINIGEELLYDYGDRNKETIESHPWLAL